MAAASPLGSLPAAAAFSRLFFLLLLALPMSGLRSPCLHGEGQSLPTPCPGSLPWLMSQKHYNCGSGKRRSAEFPMLSLSSLCPKALVRAKHGLDL